MSNKSKLINITLYSFLFLSIASILVGLYYYQVLFPPCCDVTIYREIAQYYASHWSLMLSSGASGIRLYGYPLFISLFMNFFHPIHIGVILFIAQVFLYFILVFLIVNSIEFFFANNKKLIYAALCSNILFFPYLAIGLSDALSVILWLAIAFAVIRIFMSIFSKYTKALLPFLFFGFLIGYSIMVRPSNIHLIALFPIIFLLWFYHRKQHMLQTKIFLNILIALVGFIIAVAPQIYINYRLFNIVSFLPAMNLGHAQLQWGIENLKYATNLSGIGSAQLFYKNPYLDLYESLSGVYWYLGHPLNGLKTFFLHIFASLDFDYLFPYIYELNPKYQILLFLYSHIIVFWGVYGYCKSILFFSKKNDANARIFFSLIAFVVPVVVLGWISVTGFSAVENRFSLPIVTLLLPFAFFAISSSWHNKKAIALFILYLIVAYMLSSFIAMQKNIS